MADRKAAAFAQFMKEATKPRAGTMGAGEQAACLWWASLSPRERELMYGAGEAQLFRRDGNTMLEPRWQVGLLTRELWEQLCRWSGIEDRVAAAVDTAVSECMADNTTATAPCARAAYRWWADLGDSERCDVFGQCCADWRAKMNRLTDGR